VVEVGEGREVKDPVEGVGGGCVEQVGCAGVGGGCAWYAVCGVQGGYFGVEGVDVGFIVEGATVERDVDAAG